MNTIGGYDLEDLFVGMSATFTKDLRERDVFFGSACGDKNPLYFDEDFAQRMQFGGHIAPDMLAAAVVSAAIATRLPRPGSVKISQTLDFKCPVMLGETVHTTVTVAEIRTVQQLAVLKTVCDVGGRVVLSGEAVVMLTSLAERTKAQATRCSV